MGANKKRLQLVIDYEDILIKTIELYNQAFKTDFELVKVSYDIVTLAFVEYTEASTDHVFELGSYYGRACEHFDKRSSQPPRSSWA